MSKDTAFEEVSADTVRLINACTNSKIEVPEGEEIVNMCKGFDGYGQKRYEKGCAEGRAEAHREAVRDLIKLGIPKDKIIGLGHSEALYAEVEAELFANV